MLSPEALKEIDRALGKYPADQKQSAVMAALAIAQSEHRWLSPELIEFVANYLDMPPVAVQEVATFYTMYETAPVGQYKITLCTNLPCQLSGADAAADYLKQRLGIAFNETTPDGKFTLKEGECFGACGDAPVLLVNNVHMCSLMSREKIDQLLNECPAGVKNHGPEKCEGSAE
jgi:NADH-quinone oxidoreductase subunit E